MKIETKYDIGQGVWFNVNSHTVKGVVSEINARFIHDKLTVVYGIDYSNYIGYSQVEEDNLFPTKEELLKSL